MNIHEYQAKAILKSFGAPVSRGIAVLKAEDAKKAAEELDGLGFQLALPGLVALEHRAWAGAKRAVIEEYDVRPKQELSAKMRGA